MFLGSRLRIARIAAEYTQQQMADILGMDRSSYSYYETGRYQPAPDLIKKMAALFKADVSWFVGDEQPEEMLSESGDVFSAKQQIKDSGFFDLSDDERELVGLFRMIRGTTDPDKLNEALKKFKEDFEQESTDGEKQ